MTFRGFTCCCSPRERRRADSARGPPGGKLALLGPRPPAPAARSLDGARGLPPLEPCPEVSSEGGAPEAKPPPPVERPGGPSPDEAKRPGGPSPDEVALTPRSVDTEALCASEHSEHLDSTRTGTDLVDMEALCSEHSANLDSTRTGTDLAMHEVPLSPCSIVTEEAREATPRLCEADASGSGAEHPEAAAWNVRTVASWRSAADEPPAAAREHRLGERPLDVDQVRSKLEVLESARQGGQAPPEEAPPEQQQQPERPAPGALPPVGGVGPG